MDEVQLDSVPPPALDDASVSSDDRLLLEFIHDRDTECPLCRYNLRGLTVPRCPECGKAIKLSVGLAEPFLIAWVAAFSASAPSAGVGLLFLTLVIRTGFPRNEPILFLVSFYWFLAMIPVSIALLIWRRKFLRLESGVQKRIAVAAVVTGATGFLFFVMGIH